MGGLGEEPWRVCLTPGVWGLLQVSSAYRGLGTREVLAGPPATCHLPCPPPQVCYPHYRSMGLLYLGAGPQDIVGSQSKGPHWFPIPACPGASWETNQYLKLVPGTHQCHMDPQ